MTEKDFTTFKTESKEPVSTTYKNNKIYSASNPLGGTLTLQGLKVDEQENQNNADRTSFITAMIKSRDLMYQTVILLMVQKQVTTNNYRMITYLVN